MTDDVDTLTDAPTEAGPRHRRGQAKPPPRPPSARDLRRDADRDRRARGRRRIAWALVGAVALVTVSVVGSVWWLEREPEPEAVPAAAPLAGEGESVLVLLAHEGETIGFALAAAHPDAADTVVLFPGSMSAIVPGYGSWDLAFAAGVDDADLPALTLTNLLGARVDATVVVEAAALAGPIAGATINLPQPLIVADGDDQVVAVGAGAAERDAAAVERILTQQGTDDQLSWLVRQGLVWREVLERAASDESLVFDLLEGAAGDAVGARSVLEAIAADEAATVTAAPVEPVDTLGTGAERYRLQVDDAEAFVDARIPWLDLAVGERPRVEILNGTGEVGITGPIAAALVRDGYRVVRTDNADSTDVDVTRIVGHTIENQTVALSVAELLGFGEVRIEQRQPSLIVDVTVIVGDDFS
ncbi:MAG: LytR C-terminal domain-containing protein [Acidimicrobiia bacterium]